MGYGPCWYRAVSGRSVGSEPAVRSGRLPDSAHQRLLEGINARNENIEMMWSGVADMIGSAYDRMVESLIASRTKNDMKYLRDEIRAGLNARPGMGVLLGRFLACIPSDTKYEIDWIGLQVAGYGRSEDDAIRGLQQKLNSADDWKTSCTPDNPTGAEYQMIAAPEGQNYNYSKQVGSRIFEIASKNPMNIKSEDGSIVKFLYYTEDVAFFWPEDLRY